MAGTSKVLGERRSLRQMAQDAISGQPGTCPRCGCNGPHKVLNTYIAKGAKRRRMMCRNCNYGPIFSMEYIVPKGYHVEIVRDGE